MKNRFIVSLAPYIYKAYMGIVYLTSRKSYVGFEGVRHKINCGEKIIAALWHQDILLAPYAYRHYRILTLASRSRDGELIARIIERLGFEVVRGSSSKGGGRAVKEMVEHLKGDGLQIAAITVDGPRGPAHKVKTGILFIARESGATIYPVRFSAKRAVYLSNWDRTMVPLPFNNLVFRCGKPLKIPKNAGKSDLKKLAQGLERELKETGDTQIPR